MNPGEGLNISQGGVSPISETAQHVSNVKLSSGGRAQQPALNDNLMERVLSPVSVFTPIEPLRFQLNGASEISL
jgi:hypothetical protein